MPDDFYPPLRLPFKGDYPVSFAFAARSDKEEIKKKFQEWGIVGHHGVDFGLPEGTEVIAADIGKVIQSGENGDFGISVTLEHPWGQSLYAHLKEEKVFNNQEVEQGKIIGLSGNTGATFGFHLHFAVKPIAPDINNGYLGFVDPLPYFTIQSPVPTPPPSGQYPQPTSCRLKKYQQSISQKSKSKQKKKLKLNGQKENS